MKTIYQLGFKLDLIPNNVPIVDCRVIPNPFRIDKSDAKIEREVRSHPSFEILVEKALKFLLMGDSIVIACQFGRHRSGVVTKEVSERLSKMRVSHEIRRGEKAKWRILKVEIEEKPSI